VVLNIVNPAWCKSSLGRNKKKGVGERFFESWLPRTAEMGSRTLVHGVVAGEESDGCYLSECKVKPQSAYVRSARGKQTQRRLWAEIMSRIEAVSPEVAGFVR
jgi:retinol dehydrogenase-12